VMVGGNKNVAIPATLRPLFIIKKGNLPNSSVEGAPAARLRAPKDVSIKYSLRSAFSAASGLVSLARSHSTPNIYNTLR
jgi:hypothetical protein